MTTFYLSILLSLAVTGYCGPLCQQMDQAESFGLNYPKNLHNPTKERHPNNKQGILPLPQRQYAPDTPDACDPNLVLDAVATLRGERFFFKGSFLWRAYRGGDEQPELFPINYYWPDGPASVDAAYENQESDRILFFKGRRVWAYSAADPVSGYPKSIDSFGLPNNVDKVDAALYDEDSGKTLFFVGDMYYSYDEGKETMDGGFPRRVSDTFPGITGIVTAAFQYRGATYIYSGSTIYEYDLKTRKLIRELGNDFFLPCNNY